MAAWGGALHPMSAMRRDRRRHEGATIRKLTSRLAHRRRQDGNSPRTELASRPGIAVADVGAERCSRIVVENSLPKAKADDRPAAADQPRRSLAPGVRATAFSIPKSAFAQAALLAVKTSPGGRKHAVYPRCAMPIPPSRAAAHGLQVSPCRLSACTSSPIMPHVRVSLKTHQHGGRIN